MKNYLIIILLGLLTASTLPTEAQVTNTPQEVYAALTKAEKKLWKKKAKTYKRNPKDLKILTKEHTFYQEEIARLASLNDLRGQQIADLETELRGIADLTANTIEPMATEEKGIIFKLQVGAFEKVKLPAGLDDAKNVALEEKANVQKILLGKFRDYNQAKKFQGYLKEMGIRDAWVVSYKDGIRIPIEEAIQFRP